MPRGAKSKYTNKQERKAEHIEEGYEKRGVPAKEAKRRAWATVNKIHKGGEKKGGGGYGKPEDHSPMRKGGKRGGRATAKRTRSASASRSKSSSSHRRTSRSRS
ncbi:MAG TPA: plasmid stabilization protein [Planctomycetota bacterium]|nr:plasmid stabilization protein [Planctomycetota bacterium]